VTRGTTGSAEAAIVGRALVDALRVDSAGTWRSMLSSALAVPLAEVADRHRVAPLLRQRVVGDPGIRVDPAARQVLEHAWATAVAEHLQVGADLPTVARALDDAEVAWLVMKGPVLSFLAHAGAPLRPYGDLDVLVAPRDFGRALDALGDHGARLLDVNWALQRQARRSEATLVLPGGTSLDLHWHPVNDGPTRAAFPFDVDAALARRRHLQLNPALAVPAFDPVDNLLTVALHAALSGGDRLRWVLDLDASVRVEPPDWDLVVSRAAAAHIEVPVGIMLRRAVRLLGCPVPGTTVTRLLGPPGPRYLWLGTERLATARAMATGRGTGRAVLSSLRPSVPATLAATGTTVTRHLRSRRTGRIGGANPLETPSEESTRRVYLADVAAYRPGSGTI
jgi:Uncharacterised nucleotidyltransferase